MILNVFVQFSCDWPIHLTNKFLLEFVINLKSFTLITDTLEQKTVKQLVRMGNITRIFNFG